MIKIHTGVLPTEQLDDESLVVREPAHYPIVRRHIHEALAQKEDLEVFVITRVCDGWFWDLFDYQSDVVHCNDAPTERLKRKLLVNALPTDLAKPELIVRLELFNLPGPTSGVSDVWMWIIQNKLGEIWTRKNPSQEHFSKLVNWYIEHIVDSILQPRAENIALAWINAASGKLRSAYARFFENPRRNAYVLIAWRALAPYDRELKEQWLAAEGWYSQTLEDLVELIEAPTQLPQPIRSKLNSRVQTYWNTQLKGRFDD
jgi:hypothetical protein